MNNTSDEYLTHTHTPNDVCTAQGDTPSLQAAQGICPHEWQGQQGLGAANPDS